uniref:Protein DGCR6-like isoform X2 n=1 Tax=Geotrypetes seraphini TaxID=260995 RepID=A0A6P8S1P9_GEOSA|nr:protein DGCR6-like isoform X2 [Geotrypetes seraphini]
MSSRPLPNRYSRRATQQRLPQMEALTSASRRSVEVRRRPFPRWTFGLARPGRGVHAAPIPSPGAMADLLGVYEEPPDSWQQQERHYHFLSELQSLVKELPSSCQQRLSHSILSDLALALIDGAVFEIVQGLLEIQHLTEKNLYNQRLKLHVLKQDVLRKQREAQQSCKAHNLPVLRAAQQRELEALEHRIKEEQRLMDEKIVLELDQKVVDQQSTLEKAGVSGFFVTTNPQICPELKGYVLRKKGKNLYSRKTRFQRDSKFQQNKLPSSGDTDSKNW